MGGSHAAGVAIGIVNIIGGKGTSLAMEVSAATFGAASGFITGVKHSAIYRLRQLYWRNNRSSRR